MADLKQKEGQLDMIVGYYGWCKSIPFESDKVPQSWPTGNFIVDPDTRNLEIIIERVGSKRPELYLEMDAERLYKFLRTHFED